MATWAWGIARPAPHLCGWRCRRQRGARFWVEGPRVIWGDNGKENGNYKDYIGIIGLYRVYIGAIWGDNGKENGNYDIILGLYRGEIL